jgi:hypothetical protein
MNAKRDPSDGQRYDRLLQGPQLYPFAITKSSKYCPGQIFTPELDFKTRMYATYAIDDAEAVSTLPNKRPTAQISHLPNQQQLLFPLKPSSADEFLVNDEIPPPDLSYNKFACVIPPKRLEKEISSSTKHGPESELAASLNTSLPIHKPSTNFLKGSALKATATLTRPPNETLSAPPSTVLSSSPSTLPQQYHQPMSRHPRPTRSEPHPKREGHGPVRDDDESTTALPTSIYSSSTSLSSLPPHIIHSRLMGWKLTSPERRKELIQLFEDVHLPSDQEARDGNGTGGLDGSVVREKRRVLKRQTNAYEVTIARIASKTKSKMKYSLSESKFLSLASEPPPPVITSHFATRRPDPSSDPFKALLESKDTNRLLLDGGGGELFHQIKATEDEGQSQALENLTSKWGFAAARPLAKPVVPEYQSRSRDPKTLFEQADRMELLESAASIEKAASKTISTNLELTRHSSHRPLRLPSMDPNSPPGAASSSAGQEQKVNKVVGEPFLREMTVRSASRKKRELAEERRGLESPNKERARGVESPGSGG